MFRGCCFSGINSKERLAIIHTYYCLGWRSPDANIYLNPFAAESTRLSTGHQMASYNPVQYATDCSRRSKSAECRFTRSGDPADPTFQWIDNHPLLPLEATGKIVGFAIDDEPRDHSQEAETDRGEPGKSSPLEDITTDEALQHSSEWSTEEKDSAEEGVAAEANGFIEDHERS